MSPLLARIVAAMGAGAFGQAVNVLIQLASLPLFLYRWDLPTYGTWLMLSALPAYLSMADVGMVSTAGNRMTMEMARDRVDVASAVFHSASVFMAITCLVTAMLATPAVLLFPLPGLTNIDERTALLALIYSVLLTLIGGLSDAMFRATGRYALGASLGTLVRLAEWLGWIAGLLIWGSFASVALCGLAARTGGVLVSVYISSRNAKGLRWGLSDASFAEVRAMVKPALSFMLFPLANAISFQGATLLVGHLFGTTVVALFNTYRTIARVAVQVTGTFGHALWAEFAHLFGQGGAHAVRALYMRSTWLGIAISVTLSLVLYGMAPWLLDVWTHGRIDFEPMLMSLLLAYAAVCGSWHVPRVLLMATNQHIALSAWVLAAAGGAAVLAYGLGHIWGITGVGMGILLAEMAIALVCIGLARRMMVRPV